MVSERPPDIFIFLDDFERGDVFQLLAALIPVEEAADLLDEWNNLRREIKKVLLKDYPRAKHHPKLQGNQLPEIHAVELYQSIGYYRKHKHGTNLEDPYWLQHYAWFEQSLKIIQKYNVSAYPFFGMKTLEQEVLSDYVDALEQLRVEHKIKLPMKKIQKLSFNSYTKFFPIMLITIEHYLAGKNLIGEIICDDYELSKGFSIVNAINWLNQDGQYNHLGHPRFTSSLDEALLQVSDVLSYVMGTNAYAYISEDSIDDRLSLWFGEIVRPICIDQPQLSDKHFHNIVLIAIAFIVEQCIKQEDIKELLLSNMKLTHAKRMNEL